MTRVEWRPCVVAVAVSDINIPSMFQVALCCPRGVYICDGSDGEAAELKEKMVARGLLTKLTGMDNW